MAFFPAVKTANDTASATLASSVNNLTTTWTLSTGHGARFPTLISGAEIFYVRCGDELAKVTARAGDVLTVERGQEGYAAAAHSAGAEVAYVFPEVAQRLMSPRIAAWRRHKKLGGTLLPLELGSSATSDAVARRTSINQIVFDVAPGPISKIGYMHTRTATPTATGVFLVVYSLSGSTLTLVALTADVAALIPATPQAIEFDLAAASGHSLDELPAGICSAGWWVDVLGAAPPQCARGVYSGTSAMANLGLVTGTDMPMWGLRSSADTGGPPVTILASATGPSNESQQMWLA